MRKWKNKNIPRGVVIDKRGYVFVRKFRNNKPLPKEHFGKATTENVDRAIAFANRAADELKRNKIPVSEQKEIRWTVGQALKVAIEHMPQWRWFDTPLVKFFGKFYFDELYFGNVQHYRPYRLGMLKGLDGVKFEEPLPEEKAVVDPTVNKELAFLGSAWKCLRRLKKLNQIPNVRLPEESPRAGVPSIDDAHRRRTRIISDSEFKVIMEEASPRMQRRIVAALNTCLRQKDVLALRKDSFDPIRNTISVYMHKVGESMTLESNEELAKLYFTADGDIVIDDTNHEREFLALRSRCIERGIEDFWFRDFRRTAAMTILGDERTEEAVYRVMVALGHKNIKTTLRYLGLTRKDLKVASAALAKRWKLPIQTEPQTEPIGKISTHQNDSKILVGQ